MRQAACTGAAAHENFSFSRVYIRATRLRVRC